MVLAENQAPHQKFGAKLADNDGDLDFLAFTSNSDFVTWFKNMRVENGQSCSADTLNFFRQTSCWGKFEEDFFTSSITLNRQCSNRQSGKTQLHSGSTLLLLDVDNDGDKEALIGDIASERLVFLQNGGTTTQANMISQTNVWPSANPITAAMAAVKTSNRFSIIKIPEPTPARISASGKTIFW